MEQQFGRDDVKELIATAFKTGWLAGTGRSVNIVNHSPDDSMVLIEAMKEAIADRVVFPESIANRVVFPENLSAPAK